MHVTVAAFCLTTFLFADAKDTQSGRNNARASTVAIIGSAPGRKIRAWVASHGFIDSRIQQQIVLAAPTIVSNEISNRHRAGSLKKM